MCVDAKLQPFRKSAEIFDVLIVKGTYGERIKGYSPFVGKSASPAYRKTVVTM